MEQGPSTQGCSAWVCVCVRILQQFGKGLLTVPCVKTEDGGWGNVWQKARFLSGIRFVSCGCSGLWCSEVCGAVPASMFRFSLSVTAASAASAVTAFTSQLRLLCKWISRQFSIPFFMSCTGSCHPSAAEAAMSLQGYRLQLGFFFSVKLPSLTADCATSPTMKRYTCEWDI